MNAAQKLAAYGAGLVVAFAGAYGIAGAVVPDSVVAGWERSSTSSHAGSEHQAGSSATAADTAAPAAAAIKGVSLSADGYTLGPVTAPAVPNVAGNVDFTVLDRRGEPVREFDVAHEKQLHLIAVRADEIELFVIPHARRGEFLLVDARDRFDVAAVGVHREEFDR